MLQRYEYDVIQIEVEQSAFNLPEILNQHAQKGWQVINIKWLSNEQVMLIMERPFGRNSAEELLAMGATMRQAMLAKSAELAEADYLYNSQLTDFEAFGEDDFFDDTP